MAISDRDLAIIKALWNIHSGYEIRSQLKGSCLSTMTSHIFHPAAKNKSGSLSTFNVICTLAHSTTFSIPFSTHRSISYLKWLPYNKFRPLNHSRLFRYDNWRITLPPSIVPFAVHAGVHKLISDWRPWIGESTSKSKSCHKTNRLLVALMCLRLYASDFVELERYAGNGLNIPVQVVVKS